MKIIGKNPESLADVYAHIHTGDSRKEKRETRIRGKPPDNRCNEKSIEIQGGEMKRKNDKGITIVALMVTIIVLIILSGIVIATLKKDNGVLTQTSSAKVIRIEATSREQVELAVSAIRMAIGDASSKNNSYSAVKNANLIQQRLVEILNKDKESLDGTFDYGGNQITGEAEEITIGYTGNDYKNACNNSNAKIIYTIKLGQKSIEIIKETNSGLRDSDGSDPTINLGDVNHNHKYETLVNVVPATCTEGETTYYECECGSEMKKITSEALGHNWVVKEIIKPATCKEKGQMIAKCARTGCNAEETQEIEQSGHTYGCTVTKEPTCVDVGTATYTCTTCGYSYTDTIPATGVHNYVGKITKAPTCTEMGEKTNTCTVCGASYTEKIEKDLNNHTSTSNKYTKIDDLTHKNETICDGCGATINSVSEPHNIDSNYICTNCGFEK